MKACDGVYAAGDITTFPLKMLKGELVNIGHWQMSLKHGELESFLQPVSCTFVEVTGVIHDFTSFTDTQLTAG